VVWVIFDIEATCWNENPQQGLPVSKYVPIQKDLDSLNAMEVIEIGAVALSDARRLAYGDHLEVLGEFENPFVKPTLHPKLSEFCVALTSITQADVDAADPIEVVLPRFIDWARSFNGDATFVSWGLFDKAIFERMKNKQGKDIDITYLVKHHFSAKHRAKKMGLCGAGLGKTLKHLKIPFEGRQHRGIDDARMIAKVFDRYYEKVTSEYVK
jgi:3'-5' exoribonuclease 1